MPEKSRKSKRTKEEKQEKESLPIKDNTASNLGKDSEGHASTSSLPKNRVKNLSELRIKRIKTGILRTGRRISPLVKLVRTRKRKSQITTQLLEAIAADPSKITNFAATRDEIALQIDEEDGVAGDDELEATSKVEELNTPMPAVSFPEGANTISTVTQPDPERLPDIPTEISKAMMLLMSRMLGLLAAGVSLSSRLASARIY